ncbi:MAG: BON domain-containing protein [Gammaproteobacteria bacterium]|nr:BON domain-containing protein [Gammaproteobacteria bacterium]
MNFKGTPILAALLLATLLQGCGALIVGGAAAGASVIYDRRSSEIILEDTKNELALLGKVSEDEDLANHSSLSVTSYNRVLLLTGQAETEAYRKRYETMAGATPSMKRLINEVAIGPPSTFQQTTRDSYITSKVKLEFLEIEIESFDPTRVKVVTEQNVVYLMGLVTREESEAVIEKARHVSGVKRVVKIFEYI